MPAREQTIAGKPVRIIDDISADIDTILPSFVNYDCVVLISKYNSGKSTSAVRKISGQFGRKNTEYITLTEQRKVDSNKYFEPTLRLGELPEGKTIIFDELSSDSGTAPTEMQKYIKKMLKKNRLIILTNPYGSSTNAKHEIELFMRQEQGVIPEKTLFVFVTNKTKKMRIDFFEEFPSHENLAKASLIDFESTVYIAAKSLSQFRRLEAALLSINPKLEAAYWPILPKSYWVSPFSYTDELRKLANDLSNNNKLLKVLLDLELPTLNKRLIIKNLLSFPRNKRIIKSIFRNASNWHLNILTAEYPVSSSFVKTKLEWLGVSYNAKKYPHRKILMFYTSMIRNRLLATRMKQFIESSGPALQVGLGTIAVGILGNEPILTPDALDRDLAFVRKNKKSAVIFRLGGLNDKYVKIIKKYS